VECFDGNLKIGDFRKVLSKCWGIRLKYFRGLVFEIEFNCQLISIIDQNSSKYFGPFLTLRLMVDLTQFTDKSTKSGEGGWHRR
jgi:hypothetical protein